MLQTPDRNTQRILDLATFIEALPPDLYDQRSYGILGSDEPKCICGWLQERRGESDTHDFISAADYLGLAPPEANFLFNGAPYPERLGITWRDPTTAEAARVLRHLAITGTVDWELARTKLPNLEPAAERKEPALVS